jgi:hypothetical protein
VDELFRSSKDRPADAEAPAEVPKDTSRQVSEDVELPGDKESSLRIVEDSEESPAQVAPLEAPTPPEEETKRPRHDEKVTFYCTASDLTRIERARLTLRAEYKLASDRGRIVRAALAEILDDFEERGADSALVARLQNKRGSGEAP